MAVAAGLLGFVGSFESFVVAMMSTSSVSDLYNVWRLGASQLNTQVPPEMATLAGRGAIRNKPASTWVLEYAARLACLCTQKTPLHLPSDS